MLQKMLHKKCGKNLLVMHFCMWGSHSAELRRYFAAMHHLAISKAIRGFS
jgi:hypothetical protein